MAYWSVQQIEDDLHRIRRSLSELKKSVVPMDDSSPLEVIEKAMDDLLDLDEQLEFIDETLIEIGEQPYLDPYTDNQVEEISVGVDNLDMDLDWIFYKLDALLEE